MILKDFTASNGIMIEHEPIISNIRIRKDNETVFSCEVITTGMNSARICLGSGTMNKEIYKAIMEYLKSQGYINISKEKHKNDEFIKFEGRIP